MKANRLISILMLLQTHKQITASKLAEKLEVSIRTIYRDIDQLSSIGIPIICDRGHNGGIKLIGDFQSTLTGLTKDELSYLVMNPSDKILNDLGISSPDQSMFLKLLSTASPAQTKQIEEINNYIYIDMETWHQTNHEVSYILQILQQAIWSQSILTLTYRKPSETKIITIQPLGLVCKKGTWYLIALDRDITKTYRVSSILEASLGNESFERPTNFSLKDYWKSSTTTFIKNIPKIKFTYQIEPTIKSHILSRNFLKIIDMKDNQITVEFNDLFEGLEFAFGYSNQIQILHPKEAIPLLKQKATEILELYSE